MPQAGPALPSFRRRTLWVMFAVGMTLLAVTLLGGLENGELNALRTAFRLRGAHPPVSPVVIVAIDDESFAGTGLQWPWPRTFLAQLVDRLEQAGARWVALDIFFFEPEAAGQPATYLVQGERLADIAAQYQVTVEALRTANALDAEGTVCGGQRLTIPTQPAQEHLVQRDTLAEIAARFRVDPGQLQALNRLNNPCALLPESTLLLIPALGPIPYTVQAADTVAAVAAAFQVNPRAVLTAGGDPAQDPLTTGEALHIQLGDAAFAASLQAAGNVVLNGEISKQHDLETVRQPLTNLRASAAGFGLTNIPTESADGAVHRILAWDTALDRVYFSWPFTVAALYSGLPLKATAASTGIQLGDIAVPLEGKYLRVNYAGPAGTIPTYSAWSVLTGDAQAQNPDVFRDKIVLLGATAESLHDTYPTAFELGRATPGVEIMANALDTILSNQYLYRPPRIWAILELVVALLIGGSLVRLRRVWVGLALILGLGAAYSAGWYAAFVSSGWQLPLLAPLSGLGLGFIAPTLERAVSEELEKRRVRGIFEMFISPEMVGQLIDQGIEAMRGQRAELTVLFSDIRGFTTLSEKLSPEALVAVLNEYLGMMTDIIHQHGGTVDKYEGDLIMAFFGAPLPYPDHAERAVRAALAMRQALDTLRTKWEREGKPFTLEMGIGLNTAEVFVGLIGSGRRVNYTVMGDGVNLASRIQDLTKDLRWPLLISEFTYARVQAAFDCEFGESRLVKGKTVPVGMYKVLGEKGAPPEQRVRALYE